MSKKIAKEKTAPDISEGPKFEVALTRLEKIAEEMESGKLSLEEALKHYEEGVGLARYCNEKLNEVQKRISLLKKDAQGRWMRKPFDAALEESPGDAQIFDNGTEQK